MVSWKQTILSNVASLMYLSCILTTTTIPKFPQYRNLFLWCIVFAFHQLVSFLFRIQCLLIIAKAVLPGRNSIDRNNPWLQTRYCNTHKSRLQWNNHSFPEFLGVWKLPILHPGLIRGKKYMTIFTKFLVLSFFAIESLHIFVELISRIKSCRKGFTQRTRVKMAGVNPNNWFINVRGFANKSLINNKFTCKHYSRSTDHVLADFLQQDFVALCDGIKLQTSRFMQTNVSEIGLRTSKLEHVDTLIVIKCNNFCKTSKVATTSSLLYHRIKSVFFFFPHILHGMIVFRSSRWYFTELQFSQGRFLRHSDVDHFFIVLIFLLKRVAF